MSIVEEGGPAVDPRVIRRIGYGIVVAGVVAGFAIIFVTTALMALAATALVVASVVVALLWSDTFELSGRRGVRGFNPLFAAPAGLLFFRGIDNQFIDPVSWAWAALVGAATVGVLAALRARSGSGLRRQFIIVMAITGAALGGGGPALLDVRLDTSAPQTIHTTVASMYVSHGKANLYYLRLPPWGPKTKPNTVEVEDALYNRLDPGDQVCIELRQGALGLPWFKPQDCPAATPALNP